MPNYKECSFTDVGCHTDNAFIALERFFAWVWDGVLNGIASMLELIPVPDFLQNQTLTIPDGVAWFAGALELDAGLPILVGAWAARFLVRRLPFIG